MIYACYLLRCGSASKSLDLGKVNERQLLLAGCISNPSITLLPLDFRSRLGIKVSFAEPMKTKTENFLICTEFANFKWQKGPRRGLFHRAFSL